MASSRIPAPGSEYGPCLPPCTHRDCAESRQLAAQPCVYCCADIGFGRSWCQERTGVAHFDCAEDAADAARGQK